MGRVAASGPREQDLPIAPWATQGKGCRDFKLRKLAGMTCQTRLPSSTRKPQPCFGPHGRQALCSVCHREGGHESRLQPAGGRVGLLRRGGPGRRTGLVRGEAAQDHKKQVLTTPLPTCLKPGARVARFTPLCSPCSISSCTLSI